MRSAPLFLLALMIPSFAGLAKAADSLTPAYPASGASHFTLLRNGSSLGSYDLRFESREDGLHVVTRVDVNYSLAFITLYRFEQDRNELWRDGRLASLETRTNDDGDRFALTAWATADGVQVNGREFDGLAPANIMPTGFWDIRTVERTQLLNSEDGDLLNVTAERVGEETVEVMGEAVRATHYRITGDTEKDLWYDKNGVWVALRMTASDGSTIEYRLLPPAR
ncbi:MAG: DUF6134 family protein [Proteobacteria bacterium]|nr:DUF6134 family protein [Pseudomonadota bacterium]